MIEVTLRRDNGDEVRLAVEGSVFGDYRPATWDYYGGSPAEYPEVEITKARLLDEDEDYDPWASDESGKPFDLGTLSRQELSRLESAYEEALRRGAEEARADAYDDYEPDWD